MDEIALCAVGKAFADTVVFEDFSLAIEKGQTTALLAPSGWGKTTLLRMLMGLCAPDSGKITGLAGLRQAAVFQQDCLCERLPVWANLRLPSPKLSAKQIETALENFGLSGLAARKTDTLSGGQKRRVALLRALLADFDFLLLDEPFRGLDAALLPQIIEQTHAYCKDKTVLLVTHSIDEAVQMQAQAILQYENP